jgi:hypothetical protein
VDGDLGDFLAEGGAVVGGSAAFGATLGFIAGSLIHDFKPSVNPERWARFGGVYGGVFGLVALILRGIQ